MDEKPQPIANPEVTAAESTEVKAGVSAESTTAFDSSSQPDAAVREDYQTRELSASEVILEKPPSFSFLKPPTRPGSLGRLGHFEILEQLGHGGFGIVFKAHDDKLDRLVAIKVLGPQVIGNAAARSRFVREARTAAAVNCKYVVTTYAVEEQPLPYLVMEYIAGKTLQQCLDETSPLQTRDILRIGAEIATGLAAAHRQGLIHRDIKPANILLEDATRQRVKVADFGLARAVDDASLTQSGVVAGTPMFMSPEQAQGDALDARSDLFSLGSVLYTMCTGQPPFKASKTLGVLRRVCNDTPQPIREQNAAIPDALAAIVDKLLIKDPAGRIQTAEEVAAALEQQLARLDNPPSELESSPPIPPVRKTTRWKWVAVASLLVPVLGMTLTEVTGVTHLFRDTQTPTIPEPEKPKEKPPPVAPVVEDNLYRKAAVGEWAEYRILMIVNDERYERTETAEVLAKTETTARIKTMTMVEGRTTGSREYEIDLRKPFDPSKVDPVKGSPVQVETTDSSHEKIEVGDREYDTAVRKVKLTTKKEGFERVENMTFWMSSSGPLDGQIRMQSTVVQKRAAQPVSNVQYTLQLIRSGRKLYPTEARRLAAACDWTAASAEYARVFASHPLEDGEYGFEYACVLLMAGDQAGYRKLCAEMLERCDQYAVRPYHVARACTLAPDSVKDFALPAAKAKAELDRSGEFWSLTEQGALAYRAGRYDAAVPLLQRSIQHDKRPARAVLNWLWLGMAEHRRGKPAVAKGWLEQARTWVEENPRGPVTPDDARGTHLHNWIEALILYREAERTIAGKS